MQCIPFKQCFKSGVFNVFQAKDPQTDGKIEWGPPPFLPLFCIKLCFILNWSYSAMCI